MTEFAAQGIGVDKQYYILYSMYHKQYYMTYNIIDLNNIAEQ